MKIIREEGREKIILRISGKLDVTTSPILAKEIEKALDETLEKRYDLILDFKELSYISSAGLRVLLAAEKRVEEYMGLMILENVNDQVMDVFKATGFDLFLKFREY